MDWYLLLTPLLILGVIALLGFTGCDALFNLDEIDTPAATTTLTFEARVPAYLTVLESKFEWTVPGATAPNFTTAPVVSTDGTDTVLTHVISTTTGGMWRANCRLNVQDTTLTDDDTQGGPFLLDPVVDPAVTVRFYTVGRPDTQDFQVKFFGRVAM